MSEETGGADTRRRLLEAAEVLFAEHGSTGTTVRMITERARANIAAVNYHFNGKDGLLRAVTMRRLDELEDQRIRLLAEAEAQAAQDKREITLEEIVRAFLRPLVEHGVNRETGTVAPFVRIISEMLNAPNLPWPSTEVTPPPGVVPFIAAAKRATGNPDIPTDRFALAFSLVMGLGYQAAQLIAKGMPPGLARTPLEEDIFETVVSFAAAGVRRVLDGMDG